jgi:hypothetical protein
MIIFKLAQLWASLLGSLGLVGRLIVGPSIPPFRVQQTWYQTTSAGPEWIGKRALVLKIQTLLFLTKLPSALILFKIICECCTALTEQQTTLAESI